MRATLLAAMASCQLVAHLDQPLPEAGSGSEAGSDAPAVSAYEAAVLADKPVLFYRFDETSGVLCKDKSGHANDGSIGGSFTRVPSAVGDANDGAVHFGASGQLPLDAKFDYDLSVSYALEMWVKVDVHGDLFNNLRMEGGGLQGIAAYVHDAGINPSQPSIGFEKWSRGVLAAYAHDFVTVLDTTRFEHWVFVSNAGMPTLFIDGAKVTDTATKPSSGIWTPQTILIAFPGAIDELAIYDHVLADDRVLSHFQIGRK